MDDYLLVLNAGSSSLKFTVYHNDGVRRWHVEVGGQIDGIGRAARFKANNEAGERVADDVLDQSVTDGRAALDSLAAWLRNRYAGTRPIAVGHRVVHGGARYTGPTVVTPDVIDGLRELIPLAPLHQPYNVGAIEAVADRLPGVPQVACFDTSFHRTQPPVAQLVPLPQEIRDRGVQRYGFHGLSYEYIASVLPESAPEIASGRVVVAHLGSGASLCAMHDRRSVDSTLGFTALDGLCMGTRPGALDPGVILYLFQELGLSAKDVETMLYKKSGLLALSGASNDMRDLLGADTPAARLAIDYFVYRVTKELGAMAAALGGIDGLVFTAGIGERAPEVRRRICAAAGWLGIDVDTEANEHGDTCITRPGSAVSAWVIPTNEELMIARHTGTVLGLTKARNY